MKYKTIIDKYNKEQNSLSMDEIEMRLPPELFHISPPILINIANIQPSCYYIQNLLVIFAEDLVISDIINPAKRNVLDLKNETCKNREKRNVLKKSHTRHFKAIKKQSRTGCFYSF